MPSVLGMLATCPQLPYSSPSFYTVIPSLLSLHNAFTMFPFEVLRPWSFFIITGASWTSMEPPGLPWSLLDFHGASWMSMELPGLPWSFPDLAGVPPTLLELLLLHWSSCFFLGAPCPWSSLETLCKASPVFLKLF